MVSEPLGTVLRSARDTFNAQFNAARRQMPALEPERLARFLADTVDPLAAAVHAVAPDRVAALVFAAYELGLELVGQRLLESRRGTAAIEAGWRALGAAAPGLLADDPRRLLAAASNAVHQLESTPGARPEEWTQGVAALAPSCPDVESLLRVGQVRAWMAGLAHYRAGALAVAGTLPEPLALAALGASGSFSALRDRLLADPWFVPGAETGPLVRAVGAFRGFGGVFVAPPRVALHAGHLIATSGGEGWMVAADAFGATFHRARPDELQADVSATLPAGVQWAKGTLTVRGRGVPAPLVGALTSVAADATTLALTASLTHTIALVALTALP